jgi:hypothetical protein
MKSIIEKIEGIEGVETVELTKKGFKGTFEPEKPIAISPNNKEEWDFIIGTMRINNSYIEGAYLVPINQVWGDTRQSNYNIIPFTQYLTDYSSTEEWEKYLIGEAEKRYPIGTKYIDQCGDKQVASGNKTVALNHYEHGDCCGEPRHGWMYSSGKWAEIIPKEEEIVLVEGEIYFDETDEYIFRYNKTQKGYVYDYSTLSKGGTFFSDKGYFDSADNFNAVQSTYKQKKKLIKAEIKNNYYHELRTK